MSLVIVVLVLSHSFVLRYCSLHWSETRLNWVLPGVTVRLHCPLKRKGKACSELGYGFTKVNLRKWKMIRPSFAWGDCALILPPKRKRQSKLTRILLHQGEELLKMTKLGFVWGAVHLSCLLDQKRKTFKLAYCITRVKTLIDWFAWGDCALALPSENVSSCIAPPRRTLKWKSDFRILCGRLVVYKHCIPMIRYVCVSFVYHAFNT